MRHHHGNPRCSSPAVLHTSLFIGAAVLLLLLLLLLLLWLRLLAYSSSSSFSFMLLLLLLCRPRQTSVLCGTRRGGTRMPRPAGSRCGGDF